MLLGTSGQTHRPVFSVILKTMVTSKGNQLVEQLGTEEMYKEDKCMKIQGENDNDGKLNDFTWREMSLMEKQVMTTKKTE